MALPVRAERMLAFFCPAAVHMDIFVLLLLFVLNGFFSMSEMAVVASRRARLQQLAEEGGGGAAAALELAREPSTFLSTIQVGITVIGITEALASFKKHRQTLAFIVNEYGELEGLVTVRDAMQALVGEIAAIDHEAADDIVRGDEHSWLVDGGVSIDRFKEVLEIEEELPHENTGTYNTLGGLAMLQLGRIPQVADSFEWDGWRFEVVDMDRNRVDRLLVSRRAGLAPAGTRGP